MTDQLENADLTWRDGTVPVATRFDDPYYSLADGLSETRHVFLAGNDLPARFFPGFRVAELGFGTGLGVLTAWAAWEAAGQAGPLRVTSFEAFPMSRADMARALAPFDAIADQRDRLLGAFDPDAGRAVLPTLDLTVIHGDARVTLPAWNGSADAWFLDGFAPARNPELWGPALMRDVAGHTAPGGTFATYTAAGHVRRALSDAGFAVARAPGFGRKRHMTRGVLG